MAMKLLFGALLLSLVVARRNVTNYEINLDLPPQQRYLELLPRFNSTVWGFYNQYFANDKTLTDALYHLTDERGPEPEEMQKEIEGLAAASHLPVKFVQGIQMLYELQTLMVPVENLTRVGHFPEEYAALNRIPWRGPGCTGIIATNPADGTVNHARNLDFSPVPYMTDLVYTGIFTKGGKEVFRSQMVAGYSPIVTGMRMGSNGYTLERNTRYPDHVDGNEEMFHNLVKAKRPLNGWTLRKILESTNNFDDASKAVAAARYVSTEYAIMSGVKKGVIFSKDPDTVAYIQTLNSPEGNFDEPSSYIIMTNFDFFFHDLREYFDPTGGQVGYPRRIAAQKLLNATTALTGEYLFKVINSKGVLADTIFQAVMNVELGLWNASQPDLTTVAC